MYQFWLIEWVARTVLQMISASGSAPPGTYTNGMTPGVSMAPLVVGLLVVLFFVSLKSTRLGGSH